MLLVGGLVYLFWRFDLIYHLTAKDRVIAFIRSAGTLSVPVFIGVQVLQVVVSPIPGELTGIAGGYLFGPFFGFLYSTIGLTLGSWIAFGVAHVLGLSFVEKILKQSFIKKYDYLLEHRGMLITFMLFLMPGFPKDFLCYLLGLSHMRFWKFLLIVTTGRAFGTLLLSYTGGLARQHRLLPILVLLFLSALIVLIAYFNRDRWLRLMKKEHELAERLHRRRTQRDRHSAGASK